MRRSARASPRLRRCLRCHAGSALRWFVMNGRTRRPRRSQSERPVGRRADWSDPRSANHSICLAAQHPVAPAGEKKTKGEGADKRMQASSPKNGHETHPRT